MNDLDVHVFFGTDPGFVVIVAGLHTSEQSGVEVAHWIRVQLAARTKPTRLGAIVIPEVFPDRGLEARAKEWSVGAAQWSKRDGASDDFREYRDGRHPNRQFPPPGKPLAFLDRGNLKTIDGKEIPDKKTGKPIPLLPEVRHVIQVIETVKPVRIVSVHGKRRRDEKDLKSAVNVGSITMTDKQIADWDGSAIKGVNFTGIFVDPRYDLCHSSGFYVEDCKFDLAADPAFPNVTKKGVDERFDSALSADGRADDALALSVARAVRDPTLVAGNHLGDPPQVVHYAKEEGTPVGFSLGDWGPVEVKLTSPGPGVRPGAPVFTIEVDQNHESWAFLDGVQYVDEKGNPVPQPKRPSPKLTPARFDQARSLQLQDYAQAIIGVCLS
jgi:hypothetical protein